MHRENSHNHREAGRTPKPFVFARLEDVDQDGVPELLGWEQQAELDECQPYIPMAVFSLEPRGYVRNEAMMEKWAHEHFKSWRGPEPDSTIRECEPEADDEGPDPQEPPGTAPAGR